MPGVPTFPTRGFAFDSQDVDIEGRVISGGTSLAGVEDLIATDGGGRVYAEFQNGPLLERETNLALRKFRSSIGDRVTPVTVPFCDPQHQPVTVDADGVAITSGEGAPEAISTAYAALRATTLTLAIDFPRELEGGEWFSIAHPGYGHRAYLVGDVLDQSATEATITFLPPLRDEIPAGTDLDFADPRCDMVLRGKLGGPTDLGLYNEASASFVEAPTIPFAPLSLFADSEEGVIFDVSQLRSLYSDTAGTTFAVVDGPVGKMLDLSGNDNHWTAASDAARPMLRLDDNSNYCLDFDGSNDTGVTSTFLGHTAGAFSSFAAAFADGTTGDPVPGPDSITATYSATAANRLFILYVEDSQVQVQGFDDDGDSRTAIDDDLARINAGVPFVAGVVSDGSLLRAYRNGVGQPGAPFIEAPNQPTAQAFRVGARDASNQFFDGKFYGAVHVARELDADEIADVANWLAKKAGVNRYREIDLPYFAADGANQTWMSNAAASPPARYVAALGQSWLSHEAWNERKRDREFRITVYDHDAEQWAGPFLVGSSKLSGDDHGLPSIVRDGNGYWHLFGGSHGVISDDLQHFVTDAPDDPTSWTEQPVIPGPYTYAHPEFLDDTIFLTMRRSDTSNYHLVMRHGAVAAAGVVTWGTEIDLVNATSARIYNYKNLLVGDEIHMMFTVANTADTERKGVYFLKYDTATGAMTNVDGSHAQSTEISLATAAAEYQIIADSSDDYVSFDFFYDLIDPTIMHFAYKNEGDWKYRQYVSGVAGGDTTLATADGTIEAMALFANERGQVHFYAVDFDVAYSFGGHLRRLIRAASGDWGANELVQSAVNYGIHNLYALDPGHPDLRVIWAETAPVGLVAGAPGVGVLRMYAHGDDDYLYRRQTGPIEVILDTDGAQFLSGFPADAPIGNILAYTPTGEPLETTLRVVGSDAFEIRGGWLYTTERLTATTSIEIEAHDFDRYTSRRQVTIEVVADSSYAWTNSEGADYVARTFVYWSTARKAALDSFITSLKADGVWSVLDVLVPPRGFQVHAALQNLRRDSHNAEIVNGAKSLAFLPGRAWKSHGTEGGDYLDTGFNPVEAAGYFGRNSASIGIYGSGITDSVPFFGWYDGTDGNSLGINPNGVVKFHLNQTTTSLTGNNAITVSPSLIVANRSGASAVQVYVAGAAKAVTTNATPASTALNDADFHVGRSSALGFAAYGWDGYFIGGSLDATEHGDLNTAWQAYVAAMDATA